MPRPRSTRPLAGPSHHRRIAGRLNLNRIGRRFYVVFRCAILLMPMRLGGKQPSASHSMRRWPGRGGWASQPERAISSGPAEKCGDQGNRDSMRFCARSQLTSTHGIARWRRPFAALTSPAPASRSRPATAYQGHWPDARTAMRPPIGRCDGVRPPRQLGAPSTRVEATEDQRSTAVKSRHA